MVAWGAGTKSEGVLPDLCSFEPKTTIFFAQNQPRKAFKTANQRKPDGICRNLLGVLVSKSPLLPETPQYALDVLEKWAKMTQNL